MTPASPHSPAIASAASERGTTLIYSGVLAVAALLAYANSFSVPLLFDDWLTITDNPKLRQVWPIWSALSPPENTGVGGRPIANLSFVLNYALSGESLRGFHAGNLLIHFAAALALFGVVRRTLRLPKLRERFGGAASLLGFAAAALWMLHPVQTQSVTYISQRTESLMGFFYFLTLYAFIRATQADRTWRWSALAVASCFAGMATKEGMVTAPVMILLYDYAFLTGSVSESWRRRWRLHLSLAAGWILLAMLMGGLHGRGVGFGRGMTAWTYLLIECGAIFRYLSLAFWPFPLVFDHGTDLGAPSWPQVAGAAGLVGLAGLTLYGLWRRPVVGFLLAWFLITLAPTSSIVPIPMQPISENRVYVPLAGVLTGLAVFVYVYGGRFSRVVLAAGGVALATLTWARNHDYRSEVALWEDTVAKRPASSRAHCNYGRALQEVGRLAEAKEQHLIALRLRPDYAEAHFNVAGVFGRLGQPDEALAHARRAVELDPRDQSALYNLGVAYTQKGMVHEAIAAYEAALRVRSDSAATHSNLALLLIQVRRLPEVISHAQTALRLSPDLIDARYALACGLALSGRMAEATPLFQEVVRMQPMNADAQQNLGISLHHAGRLDEAIACFDAAVRANPQHLDARVNLANTLVTRGRHAEAISHYELLLGVKPKAADLRVNYGIALAALGRRDEAIAQFNAALQLDPNLAAAREQLARMPTR